MGWSGGTEIFDCVLNKMNSISQDYEIQHSALIILAEELVKVLEDQDWDNHSESNYWTHPVIGKILGNTFEEGTRWSAHL